MPKDSLQMFVGLRNRLVAERAEMQTRLQEIDEALGAVGAVGGGEIPIPFSNDRRGRKGKRLGSPSGVTAKMRKGKRGGTPRGAMRDAIIAELQKAGKEGLHIKDLAARVGSKPANVGVWFYSTGKKVKEIKKVGPSTWGWRGK